MEEITLRVAPILDEAIRSRVFPGCVFGVVSNGKMHSIARGAYTYEEGSLLVKEDSLYDVASITKIVPTASLAQLFIEAGKLKEDDPIAAYIPELQNEYRDTILIRHLLSYTLAYPLDSRRLSSFVSSSPKELESYIFTRPLLVPPGEVYQQTNSAPFLLGVVLERLSGRSLDVLAEEYIFKPLGMHRTTFSPERFPREEIVPTEQDPIRGEVWGVVHDEGAFVFKKNGRSVGQAGLFSTAGDLLFFLDSVLQKPVSSPRAWGWQEGEEFLGSTRAPGIFGRTGFTGCSIHVNQNREYGFVLLSNRTYPHRPPDASRITAVRKAVADAVEKSTLGA